MSSEAAEASRIGSEDVLFNERLLSTHITALSAKGSVVFIGEGQHCHAHCVINGRQVTSTQVFCAAVVHGIRIQPGPGDSNAAWQVLVFGQKSLAVLLYVTAQRKFYVLLGESSIEDWIVDAGLEKDLSHIVVATGHNSLLRCQTPSLAVSCREVSEHISGKSSSKPVAKTPHSFIPEVSPATQEPESIDPVHRINKGGQSNCLAEKGGNSDGLAMKEDGNDGGLARKEGGNDGGSAVKEGGSCNGLTEKEGENNGGLAVKEGGSGGALTVVDQVACVERCVLFSGHLVMMSGCWKGAVMLAGTMALQVMVWGPWGPRDSDGSALPLHCLWGHQGSIFSITFNPSQGLITTTSDDRSLRVWEVMRQDTHTHPATLSTTTLPATPEEEQLYWTSARITEKFALYGHRARVWQSLILQSYFISAGEDSVVCVWKHSGTLAASWRAHEGASIWSLAAIEGAKARLITGGADGSVKAWSLTAMVPVRAEPVDGLPWTGSLGHEECVGPAGKHSELATQQADCNFLLNIEEENFDVAESNEPCSNTPRTAVTLKMRPSLIAARTDFPVVATEQTDNDLLLNTEGEECNVLESREPFSDTPQKALKKKPAVTVPPTSTEAATDFPRSISQMGDTCTVESHKLFSDILQKPLPIKKKSSTSTSVTADFPRCIALIGNGMVVVVTNNGKLYSKSRGGSWCLEYEDERLRNYAILEACPNRRRVAVGTLTGAIVILHLLEGKRLVVEVEAEGPPGKVFALQWLTAGCILALGAAGVMTTWEIQAEGTVRAISTHHLPISMHRWLCAVYVSSADTPTTTTMPAIPYLICGDRAGSLHLYTLTDPKPQATLRGIHGKNGVTSLLFWEDVGIVYSSGRDGCVRSIQVCGGGKGGRRLCLQPLTVTRVCGASWVARLLSVWGKLLAVCFHGVKLRLWDVEAEQMLLEVECGGAHRSWDLLVCSGDEGKEVCGEEGSLVCSFLKDGLPYTFSASLTDKLLPIIKPPMNSQETMGLCVLHQRGNEIILVTAGEDTTLRLHSLKHFRHSRPVAIVRSHLSGVRALCMVEGLGGSVNRSANDTQDNGAMQDNSGNEWRGQLTNATGKDNDTVWMVSAGGRAEFKVWQCNVNKRANTSKSFVRDSFTCKIPTHPPGKILGEESDQELSLTCQEVGSHMLRTGSHKTWKSQQLTFDPETRYMAAAAHWITSSLALIALASSDGFLRIFSFQCGGKRLGEVKGVEGMRLEEVCAVECGSCLLGVSRLGLLTRTIIVTCSTRGHVIFWDLQAVVEWLAQRTASQERASHSYNPPQPRQVTTVAAHQSGVNSISFYHQPDDCTHITMATGGDDNKISVWEVMVKRKSDGVEVVVTHCCSVFGHASQVSGMAWLSGQHLLSTSIDQRLIIWKYNGGEPTQKKRTENNIFHIKPRELNKAARQEGKTIHKELIVENRTTDLDSRELKKIIGQEDRTTQKEPSEDKATHIESRKPTRQEVRSSPEGPSEPNNIRPDDNCTNHQTLMPLDSCFTGVPDVKGIIVTDIDDGKKTEKSQVMEKRVFIYGLGLQVFDITVDGSVR